MRVEQHHGEFLLLGGIIPHERVETGQVWMGSGGTRVLVAEVTPAKDVPWIEYVWVERGKVKTHTKDSFSFQCRYCLVLPNENLPDWAKDL